MTLTGEVIEVQEPERKSRSVWADSASGPPTSETDNVNAELANLDPEAGMHLWAKMTRAAIAAAGELSHAEFRVLVIHLATIAHAPEHHQPIGRLAEQYGISRVATMSEATSELVKKGWLHRRDRGWEDAGKRRPFGYRPTQRLLDLVERTGPIRSADGSTDAETEPVTRVRSAYGSTRVRSADALEAKALTTTRAKDGSTDRWIAPGARCVTCGGPVTTDLTGQPNPQCKSCFRSAQSSPRTQGEPPPPPVYEPAPCPNALPRSEQTAAARNLRAKLRAPESAGSGLQDDTEGDRSSGEAEVATGPPGASVVVGGSTHAI